MNMKKFTAIILTFTVLFSSATDSFGLTDSYQLFLKKFLKKASGTSYSINPDINAAVKQLGSKVTAILSENTLKDVSCLSKGRQDEISILVDNYEGYNVFTLSNPNRLVVDIPNTQAPKIQKTISVNSSIVKSIRYAQFEQDTARIAIDLQGEYQFRVEEKNGRLVVYIFSPIDSTFSYYLDEDTGKLFLAGIKLCSEEKGEIIKHYTDYYSIDGKKYTLTFSNSLGNVKNRLIDIKDDLLETILINSSFITKKIYIKFNSKTKLVFKVEPCPDINGTVISFSSKPEEPSQTDRGEHDRELTTKISVNYLSSGSGDVITILADKYAGYNITRLTNPHRIVIDIPNASAPARQQTINASSSRLNSIRYAQFDSNTARVVADTKGMVQYSVEEKEGQLVIKLEDPTYKNIEYNSNGDRIYFTLRGARLTEGGQDLKRFYSGKYDISGKKYTITFPCNLADIGYGEIKINDSMLKSVEIAADAASGNTIITFHAKDKFVYEVMTRPSVNNTAITILKPYAEKDKLVVIDAGHGDTEPGAVYGDLKEKNLNLDIALRLNELLKKKNVNTYMIREDDSYVGLYERAYIANSLNASLFLSIHNNAFNSKEHGTETLYSSTNYTAKFSSKRFAQIIQNELIGKLGTYDRKIKDRPGLVVLKATKMPSALAEIAFVTNTSDRQKLMDPDFRQKAAEALCESIIKALNEI